MTKVAKVVHIYVKEKYSHGSTEEVYSVVQRLDGCKSTEICCQA